MIERLLPDCSIDEINQVLDLLVAEGKIRIKEFRNSLIPDRVIKAVELLNPLDFPIKETFVLGDQEFPRMLAGDMAGAEDIMDKFEALQSYLKTLEQRYTDITSEMTKRYWLNVATLFGLFISIFSLIIKGSDPIVIDPSVPVNIWMLVELKFAQLLPLAIILLLFVVLLRTLLRKF